MANYLVKEHPEVPEEASEGTCNPASEYRCRDSALFEGGAVIERLYRVVRCLGVGRMGAVYLCELIEDESSPPPLVAVKMLFRSICDDGQSNPLFLRFYREVDAIFRVAHPNVVNPLKFISHEGQIGYSMDYVGGGDLARLVATNGPLSESDSLIMLEQIARGMEAIHRAGVIHRDLKPDNILLDEDLRPKISDFGVAFTGTGQRLTTKGSIVGTMQYLSPEYLEKSVISRQGDIYALGAIGYELVTGVPPFWGMGLCETIESKVSRNPPNPRDISSAISDGFAEVMMRAMSMEAETRYRSAGEFYEALRGLSVLKFHDEPNLARTLNEVKNSSSIFRNVEDLDLNFVRSRDDSLNESSKYQSRSESTNSEDKRSSSHDLAHYTSGQKREYNNKSANDDGKSTVGKVEQIEQGRKYKIILSRFLILVIVILLTAIFMRWWFMSQNVFTRPSVPVLV